MTDYDPMEEFAYTRVTYDFWSDTFFPILQSILICTGIGLAIVFVPGNLSPYWSIIPFFFVLLMIIVIILAYHDTRNQKDR